MVCENSELLLSVDLLNFYTHGTFQNSNILIKGIPLSIKVDYMNSFLSEYKLLQKQKINTTLFISKEQLKFIE